MSRVTKPLTNTEIKQAKAKEKEYNLADGQGLMLRITPNGKKRWIFNYYHPYTKKRSNISFGLYPEISLAEARQKRLEARAQLENAIDPKAAKEQALREATFDHLNTLQAVTEKWLAVKRGSISEKHADDIWRSLERHLFPKLGKAPVSELKAPLVINVLQPIAAKGSLETVKRLCQRLNEIMVYATNTGIVEHNPLAGIRSAFQSPKKKSMPTIRPEQLPELLSAIQFASIKLTTRCLILWQLHTMTRPGEAAATKWTEINLDERIWTIPAERMKKRREHKIPLSPQTIKLLEIMRPVSGHREYVFPADREPRKPTNFQTANVALKRMGFKGVLVSHGLRALASTTLNEQHFDPDVIEAALAHVDPNETRRAYNRSDYFEKRREMMTWWSEHITQSNQPV